MSIRPTAPPIRDGTRDARRRRTCRQNRRIYRFPNILFFSFSFFFALLILFLACQHIVRRLISNNISFFFFLGPSNNWEIWDFLFLV